MTSATRRSPALAGQLGLKDDQRFLSEGLEEEKQADASLIKIATSEINHDAVAA
jgi:ferritin-like metal-binding protein YciE